MPSVKDKLEQLKNGSVPEKAAPACQCGTGTSRQIGGRCQG